MLEHRTHGKKFKQLQAKAAAYGTSSAAFKRIKNETRVNKLIRKKEALDLVRKTIPEVVDALNESDDALWREAQDYAA